MKITKVETFQNSLLWCGWRHAGRWLAAGVVALALPTAACAQGWKPEKTVEFVIGGGAGGGTDITARVVQKILQDLKLVPNSVVVNRPGAGHTVAWARLNQNIGDGHYISIVNELFFINRIVGRSPLSYRDFTPLAVLFNEYLVFLVRPDSPIKSAKDFLAQLKEDPTSLSIGFSAARGNNSHLSIGLAAKAARADLKQLNTPVFKSGGEALTALLGGHIDVGVTPIAPSISHILAGRLRVLAVTSLQRLGGPLANAPTWKEAGGDFEYGSWRVAFGPKDMPAAQVAFWGNAFKKLIETDAWKNEVAKNYQLTGWRSPQETRKFLETEEARLRPLLTDLGLAK